MNVSVLFVCLGNICRSPIAQGVFEEQVRQAHLGHKINVDSAGTGDWHLGYPPDKRAQATAMGRGSDISHLRARLVSREDFYHFDYILGMDRANFTALSKMRPADYPGVLGLFLEVSGTGDCLEVADPYTGDQEHFEQAINLIEQGSAGLLRRIQQDHGC